jgi:hypothetical protein
MPERTPPEGSQVHFTEQLQEALAVKREEVETERKSKPGEETAQALHGVARLALFTREFTKALSVADRAHALLPDDLTIE